MSNQTNFFLLDNRDLINALIEEVRDEVAHELYEYGVIKFKDTYRIDEIKKELLHRMENK